VCTDLLVGPETWINRRVETVELLSHQETRRKVSVDFTLSDEQLQELVTSHGTVVPIATLKKEPLRRFDLRDEAGGAVPVLGRGTNVQLAHVALLGAVLDLVPSLSRDVLGVLAADLRQIVTSPSAKAEQDLAFFLGRAEAGDTARARIANDDRCRKLLDILWDQYVLFAVLGRDSSNRRILKYSYAEGTTDYGTFEQHLRLGQFGTRLWKPDRRQFVIDCPGISQTASFHAEIVIPEEFRFETAVLYDFDAGRELCEPQTNVDQASLYAADVGEVSDPAVFAVIVGERAGHKYAAAVMSTTVAALLWLGVASGLPVSSSGPDVAIVVAGAALFTGFSASQGEHRLVKRMFAASRRWLTVVAMVALFASALFALGVPDDHPVPEWRIAAIIVTVASCRLSWSAVRAPR
jgi:hypothetical protein